MTPHLLKKKPVVTLRTTQRCNYRCRMCFYGRPEVAQKLNENDQTMPMDFYRRILGEVLPHCSRIGLADAGEFLADPYAKERLTLLAEAIRQNPEVGFLQLTNAALLTKENVNFLRGIRRFSFTISIDSCDALTYASIRRPGTLSKVLENIRSLRRNLAAIGAEDVTLQLNVVVMKRNIFSIPGLLHLAKEVHAKILVEHMAGFGPEDLYRESLFHVPAFANTFLDKCAKMADSLNVPFDRPSPFAISPDEVAAYHETSKREKARSCPQLEEGPISVSANGDTFACCQSLMIGNLQQLPFETVLHSPRFAEYRNAISAGNPLPPCDDCRFLYRSSPYLYDSSVYGMNIPPESRNLSVDPDLEKEGFHDWLDELSEKELRTQLHKDYLSKGISLHRGGISEEINKSQEEEEKNQKMARLIRQNAKVVIYPAGGQAAGLLMHSFLSQLNILGFCDQNPRLQDKPFYGYKVFSPERIPEIRPDAVLVASDLYKDEICKNLAFLQDKGIQVLAL